VESLSSADERRFLADCDEISKMLELHPQPQKDQYKAKLGLVMTPVQSHAIQA